MSDKNYTVRSLSILNVRSGTAEGDGWYQGSAMLSEGTSSGVLLIASESPPVRCDDGTLRFDGSVIIAATSGGHAAVTPEKAVGSVRAFLQGVVGDTKGATGRTLVQEVREETTRRLGDMLSKEARAALPAAQVSAILTTLEATLDGEEITKAAQARIKRDANGQSRCYAAGVATQPIVAPPAEKTKTKTKTKGKGRK